MKYMSKRNETHFSAIEHPGPKQALDFLHFCDHDVAVNIGKRYFTMD